jgi:hypothetical protein
MRHARSPSGRRAPIEGKTQSSKPLVGNECRRTASRAVPPGSGTHAYGGLVVGTTHALLTGCLARITE